MPYLLRVQLPDVPGSLGGVASKIGEAGGDIEAIEIVEKHDGFAVDDVLLELSPGATLDSIVSACSRLEGVSVLWVNRYAAGGNLFLDLEVVELLTEEPTSARSRVIDLLPAAFRVDWAARLSSDGSIVHATESTPSTTTWVDIDRPTALPAKAVSVECAIPFGDDVVVVGRRGGPEFLESEMARLGHLLALAVTISR